MKNGGVKKCGTGACVLINGESIAKRVGELAAEIENDFRAGGAESFDMLWLAEGAFMFAADLAKNFEMRMRVFSLKVSSYGSGHRPAGVPEYCGDFSPFCGREVLLVDDVLDTGATARHIVRELQKNGAAKVKTCFLLEKQNSAGNFNADFVGFKIPDKYVFGYGLDDGFYLRNLPDIMYLENGS